MANNSLFRIVLLFFCFSFFIPADAQRSDSVTAAPGRYYKKGGIHNAIWGRHYRKEWATPVRVPAFYLADSKDGLKILHEGGSRQSKSLRLQAANGKQYVLRSVDKDFSQGLGDKYRKTIVHRIASDQSSIGYPFAALSVAHMQKASGILHTNPVIIFLPQQPELAGYEEFANKMYLFEERPDEDWSDAAFFGNSHNIIGSKKLLEKLFADNDNLVDPYSYARARLFDMVIGDWSRHPDQWRWAEFDSSGKNWYKPVPRDRDQAFTKFDGLLPFIATNIAGATFLENFDGRINDVSDFNTTGHSFDRRFLLSLSRNDWNSIALSLKAALTDPVIDEAMKKIPPAIYKYNGPQISRALKSRRDRLPEYALEYYSYLNKNVQLFGTDKNEFIRIHAANGKTRVMIYKTDNAGTRDEKPHFDREFVPAETKRIYLYGFKGKDKFEAIGNRQGRTRVHIVGLGPMDSVIDHSGKFIHLHTGERNRYDTLMEKTVKLSPVLLARPQEFSLIKNDPINLFTGTGVPLGIKFSYRPQSWKRDSLEIKHVAAIMYGVTRGALSFEHASIFPQTLGSFDLILSTRIDLPAVENYFGTGNFSSFDSIIDYYRVRSNRFFAGAVFNRVGFRSNIKFNLFYQQVKVRRDENKYFPKLPSELELLQTKRYAGISGFYGYTRSDDRLMPMRGYDLNAGIGFISDLRKLPDGFIKTNTSVSGYLPLLSKLSFAIRGGYEGVIGEMPDFYHQPRLGGNTNLRGYERERFADRHIAYLNNGFRFKTFSRNFLFSGDVGMIAFTDLGLLWDRNPDLDELKKGYGIGFFICPFNRFIATASYGISKDQSDIRFQLRAFF